MKNNSHSFKVDTKTLVLLLFCHPNEEKLVAILVYSSFKRASTSLFRKTSASRILVVASQFIELNGEVK